MKLIKKLLVLPLALSLAFLVASSIVYAAECSTLPGGFCTTDNTCDQKSPEGTCSTGFCCTGTVTATGQTSDTVSCASEPGGFCTSDIAHCDQPDPKGSCSGGQSCCTGTITSTGQTSDTGGSGSSDTAGNPSGTSGGKGYLFLAPLPANPSKTLTNFSDYAQYLYITLVGLAIVFAVFMIVLGGIKYVGAQTLFEKDGGKKYINDALIGLALVLSSYLILQTLNPKLLTVGLDLQDVYIQEGMGTNIGPSDEGPNVSNPSSGNYKPGSGSGCNDSANFQSVFGSHATAMTCACKAESNGDATSESDTDCVGGGLVNGHYKRCHASGLQSWSVGLFQINLTNTDTAAAGWKDASGNALDCTKAFNGTNFHATIVNQSLYNTCMQAGKDPKNNWNAAQYLYNHSKSGVHPWCGDAKPCGSAGISAC